MDIVEKLNNLKALKDSGAITEEEFNQLKQKALDDHAAAQSAPVIAVSEDEVTGRIPVMDEKTEDLSGADEVTGRISVEAEPVATEPAAEPYPQSAPTTGPFAQNAPTAEPFAQSGGAVPGPYAAAEKVKKPLNKKLLIGIAAAAVVLLAVLLFSKGGGGLSKEMKLIQGKYDLDFIIADGTEIDPSYISATGTFEVNGDKFKLYLSLGSDIEGTISFKQTQTVSSGTTYYIYTLTGTGGGSVAAAYTEEDKTLIVFTSSTIDADNNFWFKKR